MTLIFLFIFLPFLTSFTLASLQENMNPNSLIQNISIQDSSNVSQYYLDACTTIMSGWDEIQTDGEPYTSHDMWVLWGNESPNVPFLDYFDNDQGMISKRFLHGSSFSNWQFSLTFYDGKYIDKKFVKAELVNINIPLDVTINQQNGTFTTKQDILLNLSYGENNHYDYEKQIKGQLSFYFMDKETFEPFTNIEAHDQDVSKYAVQLQFVSSDLSFYFITSLFSPTWHVSAFDVVFAFIFTGIYIPVSLLPFYTEDSRPKASLLSIILGEISSCFIFYWAMTQILYKTLFVLEFQSILLVGFLVDFFKYAIFLAKKDFPIQFSLGLLFVGLLVIGFTKVSFPLFTSFLPCLTLIPPLIIKIKRQRFRSQRYLTKFEISQWICVCLWIGYTRLWPRNFYLLAPRPLFVYLFWSIIIIQFLVSLFWKIKQLREEGEIFIANPSGFNEDIPNPRVLRDEDYFRYSFVLTEEDRNILSTKKCAVCLDNLINEQEQKLYKTPCNHVFHESCLRKCGEIKLECPYCRGRLPIFRNPVNEIV